MVGPPRTPVGRHRGWSGLGLVLAVGAVLVVLGVVIFGNGGGSGSGEHAATAPPSAAPTASRPPCTRGTPENLTVTGAITGAITCATTATCSNTPVFQLNVQITGPLDGRPASLYLRLNPFLGQGVFQTGRSGLGGPAVELVGAHDYRSVLADGTAAKGSLMVNYPPDSGTIDADLLTDGGAGIHVSGGWTCHY